ncbi:hypothetical protein BAL199_30522 [alpha proteobacterium BAL199]|nr:hypothetical protein BAL199_30522 [alpha proteobacterium BAL199]
MQKAVECVFSVSGVDRHRHMNRNRLMLTNSVDAIVALFLDSRIPPARQMDHVSCRSQRQPGPSCLGAQNQQVEPAILD